MEGDDCVCRAEVVFEEGRRKGDLTGGNDCRSRRGCFCEEGRRKGGFTEGRLFFARRGEGKEGKR
jgi:hypothetical protein